MKKYVICLLTLLSTGFYMAHANTVKPPALKLYTGNNHHIQYTGRIDFGDPMKPRFWAAGVYVKLRFKGKGCEIMLNDEMLNGTSHNYIEIAIDDQKPYRIQITDLNNNIKIGGELADKPHTLTICKDTESGIGYVEFAGIKCEKLLSLPKPPKRKLEFIGSSVTAGADMDRSLYPCNFGEWYGHHNAYMSYGAVTARNLNAQWHITAISNLGLTNSCCKLPVAPEAYDKMNMSADSLLWNFSTYQPDVVSICLGESDGAMVSDSAKFCETYVNFITDIRKNYPHADIICLSIPTIDPQLNSTLKTYTASISDYLNAQGDSKVHAYTISKKYTSGCDDHPDMGDHEQIAAELTEYIRTLKKWKE